MDESRNGQQDQKHPEGRESVCAIDRVGISIYPRQPESRDITQFQGNTQTPAQKASLIRFAEVKGSYLRGDRPDYGD